MALRGQSLVLELDPAVQADLEREATLRDLSPDALAVCAIEFFLQREQEKVQAAYIALEEAEREGFVSSEAVDLWMKSWDTEHELPMPKPDVLPAGL